MDNINVKLTKGALMSEETQTPVPAAVGILAVTGLIREIQGLGEHLAEVSAALLGPEGRTPGQRRLLVALRIGGPRTVAQLTRSLGISRQHGRILVGSLAAAGWVDQKINPEHKTSRLVVMTPRGQEGLKRILAREGEVMTRLAAALPQAKVKIAREVLTDLRAGLKG
jgi:DNA-binding MarR family transcriptional regulator